MSNFLSNFVRLTFCYEIIEFPQFFFDQLHYLGIACSRISKSSNESYFFVKIFTLDQGIHNVLCQVLTRN